MMLFLLSRTSQTGKFRRHLRYWLFVIKVFCQIGEQCIKVVVVQTGDPFFMAGFDGLPIVGSPLPGDRADERMTRSAIVEKQRLSFAGRKDLVYIDLP